jgi:hypothetical protein
MLLHVEGDVGQCLHPAKAQADVLDVEDDVADFFLGHGVLSGISGTDLGRRMDLGVEDLAAWR